MGHTSPLEVRFAAQVGHATEGMTRRDANEIVTALTQKYKDNLAVETLGKPFQESYNLETLEPTPEWLGIYEDVCAEFKNEFGMDLN